MARWSADDIPDLQGRTAVVTGANAGIGYATARALAEKGAHVVLACRNEERGTQAQHRIDEALRAAGAPAGRTELLLLDLADLKAVERFADAFREKHDTLDLLVNNAGVMAPPERYTEQGLELQFGVNVAGHFALTGRLLDCLASGARVVTVSSLAHRNGQLDLGNLRGEGRYNAWQAYAQSKLGDLLFALELQRRLDEHGRAAASLAAHPGFTATDLQRHMNAVLAFLARFISQAPPEGALPTLYAATAPAAEPGGYYGPDGLLELRGHPAPAKVAAQARDRSSARRLWEACEEATGVTYAFEA